MAGKNPGITLSFAQLGGITGVPPEFIAAMELREELQSVPNTAVPDALSDLVFFSRIETNRQDEQVRHTYYKKPGNIVLRVVNTNDAGQPVQVTRTLFPTDTAPDVPDATTSVAVQDFGNGWSIQEVSVEGTYDNEGGFTPGVFGDIKYETEIPDVVPQKFRVAAPNTSVDVTEAGEAEPPTLGPGELDRSEEQVTQFKKRTHVTHRGVITLPVSLVSKDTDGDKEVVTITETLKVAGSDATPSATQSVTVQNLGDGTVLQTVNAVPEVFSHNEFATERPDPLPQKFRAAVPSVTAGHVEAGTAAAPTLGTHDLSAEAKQVTKFTREVSVTSRDDGTPPTLTGHRTTQDLQTATVVESIVTDGTTPTASALTIEATVETLGNGQSVQTVVSVASVFPASAFTKEQADVVPQAFRALVPTLTTAATSAGTAAMPSLATGDLSAQSQQLDTFKKRDTLTHRDLTSLPAVLVGKETSAQKQEVTVTQTLQVDSDAQASPDALTDVTVENIGAGLVVETTRTVDSVFSATSYSKERPDATPEKFRVLIPTTTTAEISASSVVAPTLDSGDLSASSEMVTEFTTRNTLTSRAATALPAVLSQTSITAEGQVATQTDTLATGLQTVTGSATTVAASVENLGDGRSVKSVATVSALFDPVTYETSRPDPLPEKFRAAVPETTETHRVAGTASAPTLSDSDLVAQERQVTVFVKETSKSSRDDGDAPTLTGVRFTPQGQVATVTESIVDDGTMPTVSSLTLDASVETLGDGRSVQTVVSVASVFGENTFAKTVPDVVPERFRVALPITETSNVEAGTAGVPTLATGDLSASQEQVTAQRRRVSKRTRAGVTLPSTLSSSRVTPQGQVESVVETLDTGLQTVSASATTVEAEVQNLGNGTSLKTVGTVSSVFGEATFTKEILDITPPEFRAALPTVTTALTTLGTATTPTLEAGDLSATQTQVTVQKVRTETRNRDVLSLPVTLTNTQTTSVKQVATIARTLDVDTATVIGPDAVTDVVMQKLGDGTQLVTVTTVPDVFSATVYTKEVPDVLPERFRVAVPVTSVATTFAGTASAPTLGSGDLRAESEQLTEFTARDTTSNRDLSGDVPVLVGYDTDQDRQLVTVTENVQADEADVTPPDALTTVTAQPLGDGRLIQTVRTVPEVFSAAEYQTQRPDVTPEKFRALIPAVQTATTSAGDAAAPTLASGDITASSVQVNEFTKRDSVTTRSAVALPKTITGKETNQQKQVVSVTEKLEADTTTPTAPDAVTDVTFEKLGDGTAVETVRSISSVFNPAEKQVSRPDVTPQVFRAVIPLTTTTDIAAGSAGTPSLGTGEIERSERNLTTFTKETSVMSRSPVSLPVTITGRDTNEARQVVSVSQILEVDTTTPVAPSALQTTTFEKLGDGTAVQTVRAVSEVFPATAYETTRPDVTPDDFRALLPTTQTSTRSAATSVAAPTLATGDISATARRVDEFVIESSVTHRDLPEIPVTLTGYRTTSVGQLAQVDRMLSNEASPTASPDAVTQVTFTPLGDGRSVQELVTLPDVFPNTLFAKQRPDVTPQVFRALIPLVENASTASGDAVAPTLGTGDVERSDEQLTEFTHRVTIRNRAAVSLPVSVTGKQTNEARQVVSVTQKLEVDSATPAVPSALQTVMFEKLGDGTAVETIAVVSEVFDGREVSDQTGVDIPRKFYDVGTKIEEVVVASAGTTAVPDTVSDDGTGIIRASAQRTDEFRVRKSTSTLSPTPLTTVTEADKNEYQQVIAITSTRDDGSSDVSISATTEILRRTAIGGGQFVTEIGDVGSVFDQRTERHEQSVQVPAKFRPAEGQTVEISSVSAGTDSTPDDLGTGGVGVISATAQRITDLKVKKSTTTLTGDSVTSQTEYRKNAYDQLVTVAVVYGTDSTPPTIDSLTELVSIEAVGGGNFVKETGTVGEVFDQKVVSDVCDVTFPVEHLALASEETITTVIAGTVATPDTVSVNGLGILSASAERVSETKVRKTKRTRTGTNTALTGYEYDEVTGLLLPYTETVVAAGTAGVALASDGTYSDVRPLNTAWSIKTTRKATALTTRSYGVARHVPLPRVLTDFTGIVFSDANGNPRVATYHYELKDFSGSYEVTIDEAWQKDPFTGLTATNFAPTGFSWITPFDQGSVPECLHGAITISGTTGTDDPDWAYVTWSYSYSATSPVTVSGDVILEDVQQPWRGGWLRRTETISV